MKFIKRFFSKLLGTNGHIMFPEVELIPTFKQAISYVEKLKQEDVKTYGSSHARKTWLAVDEALRINGTKDIVSNIIDDEDEFLIRGFVFAKIKYLYDNKIK